MKANGTVLAIVSAFLFIVAIVYWFLSGDPTGTTAVSFACGLAFLISYYLLFTARRLNPLPQDLPDADISDGAGELGFFSPHSWWPIMLAGSTCLVTLGFIFGFWLTAIGGLALLVSLTGLLFEYYVGHQAHREEAGSD